MAPKEKLTAALFHARYGNLVSEHFAQHTTAHTLRIALSQRKPPIVVTDGMLKLWFAKYRLPDDAVTVDSLEELHSRYGDVLLPLAAQNPTAYRLNKVLRERTPPLYVSEEVLKRWLRRYTDGDLLGINSGLLWDRFNYIYNHYFGMCLATTLGSLWDRVGISLAFGIILGSVWYYIKNHCL